MSFEDPGSIIEDDPFGGIKKDRASNTMTPVEVNRLHSQSDRDRSPTAQHHTLGISRNQASPGDHIHDGKSSRLVGVGMALTVTTTAGTIDQKFASLLLMLHKVIDFKEV